MKVIVTADLHLHPYRDCSKNGGLDRLQDGLSALRQTLQYARERSCSWFFCGDIKVHGRVWPQAALNGALALFREYKDVQKLVFPGNYFHDGLGDNGSGLQPFAECPQTALVETPQILSLSLANAGNIAIWPWQPTVEHLPAFLEKAQKMKAKYLFGHVVLAGAKAGPADIPLEQGMALEAFGVSSKNPVFRLGIFGDVHKRQNLGSRVHYVGSPYALTWSELETDKSCTLLDLETAKMEFLPIKAPRFRVVLRADIPQDIKGIWEDDFVRILADTEIPADQLEWIRSQSGARVLKVIPQRKPKVVEKRADISAAMPLRDILPKYVRERPLENVDPKTLLKAGLQLLEGEV